MKDVPVVMGATLFFAVFFCLIMLAVDLWTTFSAPMNSAAMSSRESFTELGRR
jgi:ABC-type dipeptide/oligopeptide/nickel transport system permease component